MTKPLVSIVVPSYNQARYLPTALDSVMFQEYPNIELIICNHGSTDNTSRIIADFINSIESEKVSYLERMSDDGSKTLLRKHELRYPATRTVKVIESQENIGGTASYNEGFKAAEGEFCMYLVGDDYFFPHAISAMVDVFEKNSGLDVVYADTFVVDDAGRILQRLSKPEYSFEKCLADWFHLGVCRLYRRDLHLKCGYYDTDYRNANDYDMFLRFAMSGAKFQHLNRVLYGLRKHDPDNPDEPASWRDNGHRNLMRESIICAERAREWLKSKREA
ncbi:glycosyltransferase [Maridesulfovibrio bastinii]|uniref:glycosyltransferase n=1 Tax=Maridesulfovibrio bastinii TaxID=47157 RepID=UPI0004003C7C|nr:glycosyltransferase [Maridesulfovibrio bastinii]